MKMSCYDCFMHFCLSRWKRNSNTGPTFLQTHPKIGTLKMPLKLYGEWPTMSVSLKKLWKSSNEVLWIWLTTFYLYCPVASHRKKKFESFTLLWIVYSFTSLYHVLSGFILVEKIASVVSLLRPRTLCVVACLFSVTSVWLSMWNEFPS